MSERSVSFSAARLAQAFQRIAPYVLNTPLLRNPRVDEMCDASVWFKCENLQHIGAFKARGAFNAALQLSSQDLQKGLATHSSGNHAQALSLAAKTLEVPAHIVMPKNSPEIKVRGVRALGARIVFCEPTLAARESELEKIIAETGATFIPPYNHPHIIEGQGTAAMEVFNAGSNFDALLTPLGGGGLLSGTALAARFFSPHTRVFGTEPANADDGLRSFHSGKLEQNDPHKNTIADGLRTHLGPLTFHCIREHVSGIFTVSEEEIMGAMELVWTQLKIIVEPSAAVPVAALLKYKEQFFGQNVVIVLSGGNVDLQSVQFLKK